MKIKFDFGDCVREYELVDGAMDAILKGHEVSIRFVHPDFAEVFHLRVENMVWVKPDKIELWRK